MQNGVGNLIEFQANGSLEQHNKLIPCVVLKEPSLKTIGTIWWHASGYTALKYINDRQ